MFSANSGAFGTSETHFASFTFQSDAIVSTPQSPKLLNQFQGTGKHSFYNRVAGVLGGGKT